MTATRFGLNIDARRQTIRPVGDLDVASAPMVLDSAHVLPHVSIVTLDLRRVTFLDAAGLGAIVGLSNRLIAGGARPRLANVSQRQARIFLIGNLGSYLP